MSMENSNDTNGNRTRDLPVCSAVPQPTAPPHVHIYYISFINFICYVTTDSINMIGELEIRSK